MKTETISVVLPSFNYAEYLSQALGSLAAQKNRDWELVAVDDGSTDGSLEILRSFSERYSGRVRILTHPGQENRGLAKTLRLALDGCRGKTVAFLEADDIWTPETLTHYLSAFKDHPDAVVVHGTPKMFGDPDLVRKRSAQYLWRGFPPAGLDGGLYEAFPYLLKGNVVTTFSSIAVRKEALLPLDWNTWNEACLDWWLLSQLAVRGKFFYTPQTVVQRRLHKKSYGMRHEALSLDKEREDHAYRADIRGRLRTLLSDEMGGNDPDRYRVLMGMLEKRERLEKAVSRGVLRIAKRMLPEALKTLLRRVFFLAAYAKAF